MMEALQAWRSVAIAIVTCSMPSTESQRAIAWAFLRQHKRVLFMVLG